MQHLQIYFEINTGIQQFDAIPLKLLVAKASLSSFMCRSNYQEFVWEIIVGVSFTVFAAFMSRHLFGGLTLGSVDEYNMQNAVLVFTFRVNCELIIQP